MSTAGSIDLTTEIPAPREAVWKTLTDPGEIPRWLAPMAGAQPGAGGYIEISWGEGMTGRNTIEVWEPAARLAMGNAEMGLREDYELSETGGGTKLRLRHTGFADDDQGRAYRQSVENGWRVFMAMLRHGVTRHGGQPFRNMTLFSQVTATRAQLWDAIVGPGNLTKQGLTPEEGAAFDVDLFNGAKLRGKVLYALAPGYLVLTAENLDDSLLALLCEGGEGGSMLTITWILNGAAASKEREIRSAWEGWASRWKG